MIVDMIIPLLIITPLVFGIFGFIFPKKATLFGIVFGVIFLFLSFYLLLSVAQNSVDIYYFGGFLPPLGITFQALPFGSLLLILSSLIVFIVIVYGTTSLHRKQAALFYPLSAFLTLGFVIIYLSRDIFNIYIGLEIVSLSAVALTALEKTLKSISAALIYFITTLVASGFYLIGVAILYAQYSVLDIDSLSILIKNDFSTIVAFGFITLALLIKTAVFPFSFWLPKAHSNALSPVSALLSSLVIKVTFYLLYIFSTTLFYYTIELHTLLGYLGIGAIFYGGIKAFFATELKILIAYSTISQVGYLLLVFAIDHPYAYYAMVFVLLSHAFAKGGMFLAAGAIIKVSKTQTLDNLQGYASITPVAVFAIALSSVSLIGFPPSLGFISKWYYLQSAFETSSWIFFITVLSGGVLSALYLFKVLILFLQKPLVEIEEFKKTKEKKGFKPLQWYAFLLSFLSLFLGFFGNLLIRFLG